MHSYPLLTGSEIQLEHSWAMHLRLTANASQLHRRVIVPIDFVQEDGRDL